MNFSENCWIFGSVDYGLPLARNRPGDGTEAQ